MTSRNRLLILIAIGTTWAVAIATLSVERVADPFLFPLVAYVELIGDGGTLAPIQVGGTTYGQLNQHPGTEVMILSLSRVIGITPSALIALPVGGVMLAGLAFAFGRHSLGSTLAGGLIVLYFAYEASTLAPVTYNIFNYAWSYPIYFAFLLLLSKGLGRRGSRYSILIILLVIAGQLYHSTVFLWMTVAIGTMALLTFARARVKSETTVRPSRFVHLFLIMAITYLTINSVFYNSFLAEAVKTGFPRTTNLVVASISTYLGPASQQLGPYEIHPPLPPLFAALVVANYILIAVPLLVLGATKVGSLVLRLREVKSRRKGVNRVHPLALAILLTGFAHVGVYALYGHASFRYILLGFPLLVGLLLRRRTRKRSAIVVIFLLLVVVSIGKFVVASEGGMLRPQIGTGRTASIAHFLTESGSGLTVLGDFDLLGRVIIAASMEGESVSTSFFNSTAYAFLVSPSSESVDSELILLNFDEGVPITHGWTYFEPAVHYKDHIISNPNLSLVYSDGKLVVIAVTHGPP